MRKFKVAFIIVFQLLIQGCGGGGRSAATADLVDTDPSGIPAHTLSQQMATATELSGVTGGYSNVSIVLVREADLFFVAEISPGIKKLFRFDGTTANRISDTRGNLSLTDFNVSPYYGTLVEHEDSLYFAATNSSGKQKLFRWDGTTTTQVSSTNGAAADDYPTSLRSTSQGLYFVAASPVGGHKLHRLNADGSIERLSNVANGGLDYATPLGLVGSDFWFRADPGTGDRLYRLRGSVVEDLETISGSPYLKVTDSIVFNENVVTVLRGVDSVYRLIRLSGDITLNTIATGTTTNSFGFFGPLSESFGFTFRDATANRFRPVSVSSTFEQSVIENVVDLHSISSATEFQGLTYAMGYFVFGNDTSTTDTRIIEFSGQGARSVLSLTSSLNGKAEHLWNSSGRISFISSQADGSSVLAHILPSRVVENWTIAGGADPLNRSLSSDGGGYRCSGTRPLYYWTGFGRFLQGLDANCVPSLYRIDAL